jgi:hypothetical protein
MSDQPRFPDCVNQSLIEPSPLNAIGAYGFSIEWIDCASPYRMCIVIVQENSERSYAIRDERRFRRTKHGVESTCLWKGRLLIPNEVFDASCNRIVSAGAADAESVPFDPDGLDGELFVVKMKFGLIDQKVCFAWPEAKSIGQMRILKRECDHFLNLPRSDFIGKPRAAK